MAGKKRGVGKSRKRLGGGLARQISHLRSGIGHRSRVPADPKILPAGITVTKVIEFVCCWSKVAAVVPGAVGQPGQICLLADGKIVSFRKDLSRADLVNAMVQQSFKNTTSDVSVDIFTSYSVLKAALYGANALDDRLNTIELSLRTNAGALCVERDVGSRTRRAAVGVSPPIIEWFGAHPDPTSIALSVELGDAVTVPTSGSVANLGTLRVTMQATSAVA